MCQNITNCNFYATSYFHICARNKYAQHIVHVSHIFQGHILGMYVYTCAIHKVSGIKHVTRSTVQILFILLPYITEEICLPHFKYGSQCHYSIWARGSDICAYMCHNTTQYNTDFTFYCHGYTRNKYTHQIAHNAKYAKYLTCIYERCMSIYVPHTESLASKYMTRSIAHNFIIYFLSYCHTSLRKYGCHIANTSHTFCIAIQTLNWCIYLPKHN